MKTTKTLMAAAVAGLAAAALAAPAAMASPSAALASPPTALASRSAAALASAKGAAGKPVQDCLLPPATCYSPAQFRTAYGVQSLLAHGTDGRGKTVALLELSTPAPTQFPPVTDIRQDMTRFDSVFGLPAAHVVVDNSLARASTPWLTGGEEEQDTELVRAIAPDATIREVLINQNALATPATAITAFTAALHRAIGEADVVSISVSLGEHFFTKAEAASFHQVLAQAQARHVTVVAATGDFGASSDPAFDGGTVKEVSLPASDPLVLAVGGTTLTASHQTGAYLGETAWNTLPSEPGGHSSASGGGFSQLFAKPSYQDGVTGIDAMRGVPDVSADAGFYSGMAIAVSDSKQYLIGDATGTSAATPVWAALIALADQQAGHDLGFVNPAIYRIAQSPAYRSAFHDVTSGNNTVKDPPVTITGYHAARGWDPVTGWGTPNAQVLIPLLARG
jgi:subtilase family serine protease